MKTGATGLVLDIQAIEQHYPIPEKTYGNRRSVATEQLAQLVIGKGIVWSPCPKHGTKHCLTTSSLHAYARAHGLKVQIWHTKDGSLVLVRRA